MLFTAGMSDQQAINYKVFIKDDHNIFCQEYILIIVFTTSLLDQLETTPIRKASNQIFRSFAKFSFFEKLKNPVF